MSNFPLIHRLDTSIHQYWQNLPEAQRTLIQALRQAFRNFVRDGITGTAASGMTYYFIFSIFPLTLLVTLVIGHFANPVLAQQEVTQTLSAFLPADAVTLIHENLGYILRDNQGYSWLALIGVGWSSLGMLSEVTRVLDVIFNVPIPRTFFQQRLIASLMIIVLVTLLLILFVISAMMRLISVILLDHTWLWLWIAIRMLPIGTNMVIYALTLHRIPNCDVQWRAVWPASVIGAFGWEFIRVGLGWYVGHATRYSLIYGSISAIIILMLWVYAMALVFLLSAEICARLNEWFIESDNQILQPQSIG